jgi:uncharacterized protein (TIGR02246 family)
VEEEPGPVKEIFVEIPREPEITSVAEPVVEETPVAETLDVPEMAASADAELKVAESVEEEPSPSKSIFLEMQQEPEKASVADPEIESFAEPRIQEAHAAETKEVVAVASTRDEVLRVPASVEEGPGPSKSIFLEVHPIKVVASQHSAVKNRRLPIEIRAFDKIFAAAEEELKKTARGRLVITVATLTVMAIAGARYIAGRQGGAVPEGEQAPVALSSPPTLISVAAKPVAASATPPPAPAPPAAAPDPTASEDPAEVVKQWETALRTRDAAAQAAFYADPVDRYFLRHNLSKDAVVADKQAAIDKRKGGWTVKMDRVKVQRKGDDVADVSLVKHYMEQQDGATTSEWFVPSRLQLKRADGKWRIVSERDLGWATSLDDLDG